MDKLPWLTNQEYRDQNYRYQRDNLSCSRILSDGDPQLTEPWKSSQISTDSEGKLNLGLHSLLCSPSKCFHQKQASFLLVPLPHSNDGKAAILPQKVYYFEFQLQLEF